MADPMLRRLSVLAAKVETTSGTAEALTLAEGAFNVFGFEIQPNQEFLQREGQGSFSQMSGVIGARMGTATFTVECNGTGAAGVPSWASVFLPACGLVNSAGTFSLKSEAPGSNVKTVTIGKYTDGILETLSGAAGNAVFNFPTGRIATVTFNFSGIYDETPSDTAIIAPNYPDNLALRFAGSTFSIGAYVPKVSNVSIDLGNQVVMREDQATLCGYKAAVITGRRPTGSCDPELTLVATKDWHNEWVSQTEQALSLIIGSANNRVTIAAPKLQFTNIQSANRNDISTVAVEFQLNRSVDSGNDEFSIMFD